MLMLFYGRMIYNLIHMRAWAAVQEYVVICQNLIIHWKLVPLPGYQILSKYRYIELFTRQNLDIELSQICTVYIIISSLWFDFPKLGCVISLWISKPPHFGCILNCLPFRAVSYHYQCHFSPAVIPVPFHKTCILVILLILGWLRHPLQPLPMRIGVGILTTHTTSKLLLQPFVPTSLIIFTIHSSSSILLTTRQPLRALPGNRTPLP